MSFPEAVVAVARDRAKRIDDDARAAVLELLDRLGDTNDAEVAGWARTHPGAAALRERWASELAAAAMEATAPIWAEVDRANAADELDGDVDNLQCIYSATEANGRHRAVSRVLSSPVLCDETRAAAWAMLDAETARRNGDPELDAELTASPNEWATSYLIAAPWEWLGGWYDQPEPDEKPVPDGFEVVSRWVSEALSRWAAEGVANRWRVIRPAGPPRYLRAFTRDLWCSRWHDEAQKARATVKAPALVIPVHRQVGEALVALSSPRDAGRQLTLPGLVPVLSEGADAIAQALAAAERVSPVLAHRTVRGLVRWGAEVYSMGEGWRVGLAEGVEGQRTAGGIVELWIEGGLDALRVALGSPSKKDNMRAVLGILAVHGAQWATTTAHGIAPLLSFTEQRASAGTPARLTLRLHELLLPGVASNSRTPTRDRVLVPCLDVPALPSGPRWAGRLATLDWLALETLARQRDELRTHGGVAVDWRGLARRAGASDAAREAALALWTTPGEGQRWEALPRGRYRLAGGPAEEQAHRLLVDGATKAHQGSLGGKAAARRRGAR